MMGKIDKLPIELKPATALRIYKFLSEFEYDFKNEVKATALMNSYIEFRDEVMKKITNKQIDDAFIEIEIETALGYEPKNKD